METMATQNRVLRFFRHFLRFGFAGAVVAAIQGGGFVVLVDLEWAGPHLANVMAFVPATAVAFAVHYRWTFAGARRPARAAWRFAGAKLLGLAINAGGVWLVTEALGLGHYLALPFMILITPLSVFTLSKYWAFRDVRHAFREEPEAAA